MIDPEIINLKLIRELDVLPEINANTLIPGASVGIDMGSMTLGRVTTLVSAALISTPSNILDNALLSRDGSKVLNIYDQYTGISFNASKISSLPIGINTVDNYVFFNNPIKFGGGFLKRDFEGGLNVKWYGAIGDFDIISGIGTNNTDIFNLAASIAIILKIPLLIPQGNYLVNKFGRYNNLNITAVGSVSIYLKYISSLSVVMGQAGDNSLVTGIRFISLEANLPNQRFAFEQVSNAYYRRCHFEGFRDPAALPNAWGPYAKNSTNCTLDNCTFANNSQSDIAIVENNRNFSVINAVNTVNGGAYLNIEPNTNIINIGINVLGGKFRKMSPLLNSASAVSIQAMVVTAAEITELMYDGADLTLINCKISSITNQQNVQIFFGQLNVSLSLGPNIIKDPYIFDINPTGLDPAGLNRQWKSFSGTFRTDRVGKDYITIGDGTSISSNVTNVDKIAVDPSSTYLMSLNTRSNYKADSAFIGRSLDVRYYDSADILIETSNCYVNLAPSGIVITTEFKNQSGVLKTPANCSYVTLIIGNISTSTKTTDIKFISLNKVIGYDGGVSVSEYISANMPKGIYKAPSPPVLTGNSSAGAKLGDVVVNSVPTINGISEWTCIAEGKPATFVPTGISLNEFGLRTSGTTAQRPIVTTIGYAYMDTTIGRIVQWDGTKWTSGFDQYGIGITGNIGVPLPNNTLNDNTIPSGLYSTNITTIGSPLIGLVPPSSGVVIIEKSSGAGFVTQKIQNIGNTDVDRLYIRHYKATAAIPGWSQWVEMSRKAIIDTTTVAYTKSTLNAAYPEAKVDDMVVQDGAGFTYIKKDDLSTGNWSKFITSQLS